MNNGVTRAMLVASLSILVTSSSSQAHVLLDTPQATQGTFYKAVFRVPHGCHGAATTALKVEIPEGLIDAKPMPKPGWTVTTTKGAYKKTYAFHHASLSQGVTSVTWSGGNLPDDEYDEFVVAVHVADSLTPGSMVHFPAFQTCGSETIAFTDIPQSGHTEATKTPAPGLRILAGGKPAPTPIVTSNSLEIMTPWLRATPNGVTVAGGYVGIANKGNQPDRLIGATIPLAQRATIHTMSMENGTSRMRELANGLDIKPGETVELKPGSYHIMFEGLTRPLKQGDVIQGTLIFAKAGQVDVTFRVGGMGDQTPPAASGSMHMQMH